MVGNYRRNRTDGCGGVLRACTLVGLLAGGILAGILDRATNW